MIDQRQEFGLGLDLVDLVQNQDRRLFRLFDQIEHEPVAVAGRNTRIAHQHKKVDGKNSIMHCSHHPAVEQKSGLMDAGSVDEYDLSFWRGNDALYLVAGSLRLI